MTDNRIKLINKPLYLILRLARSITFGLLMIIFALFCGMLGYHEFENMSWVDSFVNAAMILSGMGPMGALTTVGGKIFAGCYALFSGLAFILIIGIIFAPIIHLFFHKIHVDAETSLRRQEK